MKLQKALFELF